MIEIPCMLNNLAEEQTKGMQIFPPKVLCKAQSKMYCTQELDVLYSKQDAIFPIWMYSPFPFSAYTLANITMGMKTRV